MNLRSILKWVAAAGDPITLRNLILAETDDFGKQPPELKGAILNFRAIVKDDDAWFYDYETARGLFDGVQLPTPGIVQGDFLDWLKENWKDILAALLDLFAEGDVQKFRERYWDRLPQLKQLVHAAKAIEKNEVTCDLFCQWAECRVGEDLDMVAAVSKPDWVDKRALTICSQVDEAGIDPATIIILVELAIKLIEWWRNRRS